MDDRNGIPAGKNTQLDSVEINPYYGTAKDVVDRYTHCTLCGANLHFTHVTDFHRNLTQETAKCPECGVKIRQVLHKLQ